MSLIQRRGLDERLFRWVARRNPPISHRWQVSPRRIYILPTRAGILFGAMLLLLLLGGLNYNNNMVLAFTFLLAGMGVLSMWHTHRNLIDLELDWMGAEPVFAGHAPRVSLEVRNPSGTARRDLVLRCGHIVDTSFDLEARASAQIDVELPSWPRGHWAPDRFTLSTTAPLALCRAWTWGIYRQSVLVYPEPSIVPANLPRAEHSDGDRLPVSGSDDYLGFRTAQPEDPPAHIAWKLTARTGMPVAKLFSDTQTTETWLDWYVLPHADVETRLSHLCAGVLANGRKAEAYGLRLPNLVIPPSGGDRHRRRCLEALANYPGDA